MGKKKVKEPDVAPKDEFDAVELITKRPQTVVLVLQSQEEAVLQTVCEALYKYADKTAENKVQLLNFGALEYLIKLISHEDKIIKRNAVMCLGTVASEESARRVMRKLGCIPPLLVLLSPEEEIVCHEFATLALSWLAEDYTSKAEIFDKQGLPLLINHLTSHDCDVQRNSVRAVGLLLEDFQCRAAFKDLNGVDPLLKLLDSDYPVIQDLALTALVACVQDADNRNSLRELDGLTKIVDIIGNEAMNDLHIPCLKCLAICLDDTESLKLIQSTGVFQKLLAFTAEATNPDTQHFAASVIAASCKIDENRRIFNEQETEKTLITLLGSDNISVVIAATSALAAMAENLTSREKIGKLDGIPLIIPLLKNDTPEAKETASLALANLTNTNPSNCAVVMEKNTIDILIRLLSDQNSETQSNCAICLSNLALNETWRSEIEKHGVIKGLINAIKSTDPKVQIYTCQALAAFVYDHDSRMQVMSEEGIPHLVSLIKSNNETVRRNASWVIVLCAVDGTLAEEITKCGGLDALQEISLSSRRSDFSDIALQRLLDSNLSAKYSVSGVLTFDNIIDDLFYDAGKTGPGKTFLTLNELSSQEMNQNRPVILINFQTNKSAKEENSENQPVITPDKTLEKNKSNSRHAPRKQSRSKVSSKERGEENTKAQELEEIQNDKEKEVEEEKIVKKKFFRPPIDDEFILYLSQVKDDISSIMSTELQIRTLACFVCEKMGGVVVKSELTRFSYELHISELKNEYDSNIIPIGKIKQGIYYHRALLFKVLADSLSLPCSLIRGDYGRSWNEVQVCDIDENGQAILPPKLYVVDLIHQPGDLLSSGSPEAVSYQRI